ncbi:Ig-like domain-containing protein [Staphylococcus schweitzeri]|uniref:Phage phiSLT minor tail protein n=1 Tax=Staphylococcus schweitzeri TaxID=1654388 RepID=A0A077UDF6_9STAP|nr:Ig-like domain-containing protein [Staphylococcus schweitzeri]CDR26529.1 phage phiSLT minor tail protein [Staphylococcus schweitzeri]
MEAILKVYKGNEVVGQSISSINDDTGTHYETLISITGLNHDTVYQEGSLQAVWEIDGVESERTNVPEFRTGYITVESFTIDQHEINLKVNDYTILGHEIRPYDATDQSVTYISKNPDIAFVDDIGRVTGISPGTTEIEAYVFDLQGQKEVCVVNVTE